MILYAGNNAFVLRRKEPFIDWIKKISLIQETIGKVTISEEDIQLNPSVYLIPNFNSSDEAIAYIEKNFEAFFENELAEWCVDMSLWPFEINLKTFHAWFKLELHSAIIDTLE